MVGTGWQGETNETGIWHASGGEGEELVLLLHGLAANADVFRRLTSLVAARGKRWLAPDFRGHGRSLMAGPWGYGIHAADVAGLIADEKPGAVTVLGHSFGGVVGALLGSGLFGTMPARVIGLGIKLDWAQEEIAGALSRSTRPPRQFATREEAVAQYLRQSGLAGIVAADSPETKAGAAESGDGCAVAFHPGAYSAVGPSIDDIIANCKCPLRLAAGSQDPMVSQAAMQRLVAEPILLPGLGHNAHVEAPEAVASLLN